MVATPTDAIVDYQDNAAGIAQKIPGSLLVTISNGSHAGFNYLSRPLRFMNNPDQLGCWSLSLLGDESATENWSQQLGTAEQGVVAIEEKPLCALNPLPGAINPIHQQALTTLVVASFLQCHLTRDEALRNQHCDYLLHEAATELPDIRIATQPGPPPVTWQHHDVMIRDR